jgi:glycine cleavage system H lipoate-binding protein
VSAGDDHPQLSRVSSFLSIIISERHFALHVHCQQLCRREVETNARPEEVMSILFVLLMFLLIISISYFRHPQQATVTPEMRARPPMPRMQREYGFQIPEGYAFHPGHTWAHKESSDNARVGIDSFAVNLLGKIDRIEIAGPNRWVRQGQKLMTVVAGGNAYEMLSPVEGVIMHINDDVVHDPTLMMHDPYKDGWIVTIKSPDLAINEKNLVQGPMVAPWMQNNVTRLNAMLAQLSPALAQDGGIPLSGVLIQVAPELRRRIAREFLLS